MNYNVFDEIPIKPNQEYLKQKEKQAQEKKSIQHKRNIKPPMLEEIPSNSTLSNNNNFDERPLKSNPQYLQEKEKQYHQRKCHDDFLRKHQFEDKVLPCFRQSIAHLKGQTNHKDTKKHLKSKADIYQEIKRKNSQKFGERKVQSEHLQIEQKKLHPAKMTINYKPKQAITIDTNEYKQKSKRQQNQQSQNLAASKFQSTETPKQKYQKLLDIIKKEQEQLHDEKQNFQKYKQKLEFKKYISSEQTAPFLNQLQAQIRQKKLQQRKKQIQMYKSRRCDNTMLQNPQKNKQSAKIKTGETKEQNGQHQNLEEIQGKIASLQQQKQNIEDQILKNHRHAYVDQNGVICTKYSIEEVSQIPSFDLQSFRDFIDLKTLYPENNDFYQTAFKVFESSLNIQQAKMKLKVDNLSPPLNIANSDGSHILRKFEGQKRLTKYDNGWIEVWTPGIQRIMSNNQIGYKIAWLKNGDVRQTWKKKNLQLYYSKAKEVVKISYKSYQAIYFFLKLNQLQQYSKDKKWKNVLFKGLRLEVFSTEEDKMNGFAV